MGSSSVKLITPVSASRKELLHAPSKKLDRDARSARCTGYLLFAVTMVRSEYFPESNILRHLARSVVDVGGTYDANADISSMVGVSIA